jgi:hypothetical protein
MSLAPLGMDAAIALLGVSLYRPEDRPSSDRNTFFTQDCHYPTPVAKAIDIRDYLLQPSKRIGVILGTRVPKRLGRYVVTTGFSVTYRDGTGKLRRQVIPHRIILNIVADSPRSPGCVTG